ncbi:hypothetical protein BpHYR1_015708 [Brachionus plicatilis]|uniref:Uncharacterized protein n=1 Tax=Brachionus plicatilis TaxID=10195 RepID=A0A3M7RFM7_BRAPC|nr:hypothetical protein BpHYR1_015708 [Brachionus plicatilis]
MKSVLVCILIWSCCKYVHLIVSERKPSWRACPSANTQVTSLDKLKPETTVVAKNLKLKTSKKECLNNKN